MSQLVSYKDKPSLRKRFKTWRRTKAPKRVRLNRSRSGDIFLFLVLLTFGVFSAYPLIFTVANAFKPLDEIFVFPPRLFPRNWTMNNFGDLFNLMGDSWVPFSRYLFNTVFITVVGTAGHVILASMAAYPLAKHRFPGKTLLFTLVIYSLMFSSQVTAIPNYMILSWLGFLPFIEFIDSHFAIILPAFAFPLGLYLMKNFMQTIPTTLIEAAKIDGASEYRVFWQVVMPLVKPAWLTLIILLFQSLWSTDGGRFIYSEHLKPLSYALGQVVQGGIARTGAASAVSAIMLIVPITVFVINQSRMIETMSHSGLK
ncbi:MAG: carbohydrate ABC transporter permease [Candidatus Izemoplasmataceae bacterium]|uniref:carbohydrate ABC transporter permease n=1 Tax=Liberiplasma polymorphum TaxID=3374570 RepID=UPI003775C7AE